MNWFLIFIFSAVCLWLVASGLTRAGKIYEYPFLAGTTFLGFVLPQLPALADDPFLPASAFAKTMVVTIFCAVSCGLGWIAGNRPLRTLQWRLDGQRLLGSAALLSAAGAFFYFQLSRLPSELTSASQWSGLPVAYLFLGRTLTYGFVIALLCFIRRPRIVPLCLALFGALLILDRIVVAGRRGEITEFLLTLLLAVWFYRGIAVPRALALVGTLAAGLALNSVGDYRAISQGDADNKWSELSNIPVIDNFWKLLQYGGPEMRNAVVRIYSVDRSLTFDYGIVHWNILVDNFVPAQIVGATFKESLRISIPGESEWLRDYVPSGGSTETGMTDAFVSFWYFGAVKFLLVGYILGRIYRTAMAGWAVAQLLYIFSLAPAMLAITHNVHPLFWSWEHMALFLLPFLAVARAAGEPGSNPSPLGKPLEQTRFPSLALAPSARRH
jgi:hypothetical protein